MRTFARIVEIALILALPLFLPTCAQDGKTASVANRASSLALASESQEKTVSIDYKIAPRDILEVSVFQVNDLNKTVQVSDDGNIFLPLIGKIIVRNKTTHEAEEIIAAKLKKGYLQSPQVSVFVKQYGQRVTISGEVKTPRVLSIDGTITLTQSIASAGGFGDLADTKRVHIARAANQRINDQVYDLDEVQAGKVADPVLQGGDLVVVEQSGTKVTLKNLKDLLPFAILAPLM